MTEPRFCVRCLGLVKLGTCERCGSDASDRLRWLAEGSPAPPTIERFNRADEKAAATFLVCPVCKAGPFAEDGVCDTCGADRAGCAFLAQTCPLCGEGGPLAPERGRYCPPNDYNPGFCGGCRVEFPATKEPVVVATVAGIPRRGSSVLLLFILGMVIGLIVKACAK